MYQIIDDRGTGKTSRLLLLAKENNGIVICKEPDKLREKAYAYGITGVDYISYYGYYQIIKEDEITGKNIFIDELEEFLKYITGKEIKGYTLCK